MAKKIVFAAGSGIQGQDSWCYHVWGVGVYRTVPTAGTASANGANSVDVRKAAKGQERRGDVSEWLKMWLLSFSRFDSTSPLAMHGQRRIEPGVAIFYKFGYKH